MTHTKAMTAALFGFAAASMSAPIGRAASQPVKHGSSAKTAARMKTKAAHRARMAQKGKK